MNCIESDLQQVYSPYKSMPMASEHWQNRGTIGDFFTLVPFHGNYSESEQWNKFSLLKLKEQGGDEDNIFSSFK